MNNPLKCCTCCGIEKPLTEFYKDKQNNGGFTYHCKECTKARSRKWHHANKDKAQESSRAYRAAHREELLAKKRAYAKENRAQADARHAKWREANRQHVREYSQKWVQNNLEKRREIARRHYSNNRPKRLESRRRWEAANPQAKRAHKLTRRARQYALPANFSGHDWQRCLDYWHHCCAVCGRQSTDLFGKRTIAADHWIPIASSNCPGTIPTNIIPLCQGDDGCNNSKSNIHPEKWLVRKLGKRQAALKLAEIRAYFASLNSP